MTTEGDEYMSDEAWMQCSTYNASKLPTRTSMPKAGMAAKGWRPLPLGCDAAADLGVDLQP